MTKLKTILLSMTIGVFINGCTPIKAPSTTQEIKPVTISRIEYYEHADDSKPSELSEDLMNSLTVAMSKINLDDRVPFVRHLLVGPDCKFTVHRSDGSQMSLLLLGRGILTDEAISISWDFPYGDEFLKSLRK